MLRVGGLGLMASLAVLGPGGVAVGLTTDADLIFRLIGAEESARAAARVSVLASQDRGWIPALVDALFFASGEARQDVLICLERLSGAKIGSRYQDWVEYVGAHEEIRPRAGYQALKGALFSRIDPSFVRFLDPALPLTIRPEEIVWGGVRKDGIPALKNPRVLRAEEARFLEDGEAVFGVGFGGEFRAYPQRILDWHEMVNDSVAGQRFALSYCTLCGSAIAYATRLADGRVLTFGSSGLLYRSNKLMYDEETLSLWSNLTGEPVGGALAGTGIALAALPLTVSTWKEWKERHPSTTVVGLETGYRRDYRPGAAYGKYFASPETMFPVWKRDAALEPKAWVYALRVGLSAMAYPLDVLLKERVVNDTVGGTTVVVVADGGGGVRAYLRGDREFAEGPSPARLVESATGNLWRVAEDCLTSETQPGARLDRLAGHRAYWFGWYAFFPATGLYRGCAASLEQGVRAR